MFRSLSLVVGIVTSLRTGRSGVRIAVGKTDFSFVQNAQAGSGVLPSLLFKGYRSSFSEIKRPGSDVHNSPSSSAEVKNEWSYTSSSSPWLHGLDRINLSFTTGNTKKITARTFEWGMHWCR